MPTDNTTPDQNIPIAVPGTSVSPQTPPASAPQPVPPPSEPISPVTAVPSEPTAPLPPAQPAASAPPSTESIALPKRPMATLARPTPIMAPSLGTVHPAGTSAAAVPSPVSAPPLVPVGVQSPAPPANKAYANLAITSLVLGAIAIPASLLSVITIFIPVLGIVFGAISLKSSKRGMAVSGLILSVIGLILSIAFLIFGTRLVGLRSNSGSNSNSGGSSTVKAVKSVDTACFTTKLPSTYQASITSESCTLKAVANDKQSDFVVAAHTPPFGFTPDKLSSVGDAIVNEVINENPGTLIASKTTATFAGKQAYRVNVTEPNKQKGFFVIVYTDKAYGDAKYQLFLIGVDTFGTDTLLKSAEQNWQWH